MLKAVVTQPFAKRFARAVRTGAGSLCLGLFLMVEAMAIAPAFHNWLHHDAGDPNHECAVTMLLQGQTHTPTTSVDIPLRKVVLVESSPPRSQVFVSADVRLLPSRGPPA